jgi:hypothetical protein
LPDAPRSSEPPKDPAEPEQPQKPQPEQPAEPAPEAQTPVSEKQRLMDAAQRVSERGGQWSMQGLIMREFIARDIAPHIAAGFVGNAIQESSLRPDAVQPNGDHAEGLWQMTYGRAKAQRDYAASKGKPWQDPVMQIEHVVDELHGSESRAWDKIRNTGTPEDAAAAICTDFERAGKADMPDRTGGARAAYDALQQELR